LKETKVKQLAEIEQRLRKRLADLYEDTRLTVMGRGGREAQVLLLDAAPAKAALAAGSPFAEGDKGYLDALLRRCGLQPEALYATYVCKFRPCRINARGTPANRPPNKEELALFLPFLREEISVIAPRLIVTWGSVAYAALTGDTTPLISRHGIPVTLENRILFPMLHPASVRFNPALFCLYEQDLLRLEMVVQECFPKK
jgi:DNA polymerase